MTRKKVLTDENESENIADLEDGEKLILQDTRTIEKKTVSSKNQTAESEIKEFEPDDYDDAEIYTSPEYSSTSLAAMISNADDNIEDELCSVSIRREPDNFNDKFLNRNSSRLQLPAMRNVEITTEREDIEEKVREIHGGGHYLFQIYYGKGLAKTWKQSLSDSPEAIAKAKADAQAEHERQNPKPAEASPQPAIGPTAENPFDQFFNTLKRQKEMKELLFGDEIRELEELRKERGQQQPTAEPTSEKLAILQYIEKMNNSAIQEKVLGYIFEEDSGGGVLDTVKWIFSNGATVKDFASMIFGGMMPTAPIQPNDFEALLKSQPPTATANPQQPTANNKALQSPSRSNFKRRKPAAEPVEKTEKTENTETPNNIDE